MSDKDRSYITDDDGNVKGVQDYSDDGRVDLYSFDNDGNHSHDVFSSMHDYMEKVDNAFAGEGDTHGDVHHRDADDHPEDHPWKDFDGVM